MNISTHISHADGRAQVREDEAGTCAPSPTRSKNPSEETGLSNNAWQRDGNCIIDSLSSTIIDKWNCSIWDRATVTCELQRIFSSRTCNGGPRRARDGSRNVKYDNRYVYIEFDIIVVENTRLGFSRGKGGGVMDERMREVETKRRYFFLFDQSQLIDESGRRRNWKGARQID